MTKKACVKEFLMSYGFRSHGNDLPAIREAFNNYTYMLCKNGYITAHQYDTWCVNFVWSIKFGRWTIKNA
jgi:hypothetical protein